MLKTVEKDLENSGESKKKLILRSRGFVHTLRSGELPNILIEKH